VLQCVAVCCSVLQCVCVDAVGVSTYVAMCCSVLQCGAKVCCGMRGIKAAAPVGAVMECMCYSMLHCGAARRSVLQCIAVSCNVLHEWRHCSSP